MKKLIFIILFCNHFSFFSISQSIYFNKRIPIPGGLEASTSLININNKYLIRGDYLVETGARYWFLSQLDSVANLEWTKTYYTPGYFYYTGYQGSLFLTPDNYFALCGSNHPPGPRCNGVLLKVDSSGNKLWEREYDILDDITFSSGSITKDSGFILTGQALIEPGKYQYLLFKTNKYGEMHWYKTYTDSDPLRNYSGGAVIQTPDSGYCIGGSGGFYHVQTGQMRAITNIIKTDSLGNLQWKKTYGDPKYGNGGGFLCLSNDSCIVATYSLTTQFIYTYNEPKQPYIVKFGLDGSIKWERKIATVEPCNGTAWIVQLKDNDFILCGDHRIQDTFYRNVGWLYKIKHNGDSLWYREYAYLHGPTEMNQLLQVIPMPDKGFACTGTLLFTEEGEQDAWVFKTDSIGCLIPGCDVGISEFNPNAGAQLLIHPNPFTNAFAINYHIPVEAKSYIFELHDIFGKLLFSTPLNNKLNQLQLVTNSLSPGLYIATLVIDGKYTITQKIIKTIN